MARFSFDIPHGLTAADARARLRGAVPDLEREYGAACRWEGDDKLTVSRKGLTAAVRVEERRVAIELELGLLLAAMSGALREGITRRLTKLLA